MALGEISPREHPQDLLGKLQQAEPVRDRRLRAADALGNITERELEFVDERGVRSRLLDCRELLARDVLHKPQEQRVAVAHLLDDRRQRRGPGRAGCTPAALSGDDLVPALDSRPDDDRLEDALQPD